MQIVKSFHWCYTNRALPIAFIQLHLQCLCIFHKYQELLYCVALNYIYCKKVWRLCTMKLHYNSLGRCRREISLRPQCSIASFKEFAYFVGYILALKEHITLSCLLSSVVPSFCLIHAQFNMTSTTIFLSTKFLCRFLKYYHSVFSNGIISFLRWDEIHILE